MSYDNFPILKAGSNNYIKDADTIQPVGLFENLSKEDDEKAKEYAKDALLKADAYNKDKNLAKDCLLVPKQKFCVLCWVGPTFRAKTDLYGFRIMGAFPSKYEANLYALNVSKIDPIYDVGIAEMNLWCLSYPDSSDCVYDDQGNVDDKKTMDKIEDIINNFIIKHKTKLEEAKQIFEFRKIAVQKSSKTKEVEEEVTKEFPTGNINQEMEINHLKDVSKWLVNTEDNNYEESESEEEIKNDVENDVEKTKILEHDCKIKYPEQEYAVISYVGNTGKNRRVPLCIKGVFSNLSDAEKHITKLIQMDDTYDILPVPMYKWLLCDPDTTTVREIHKNEYLNELLETDENQREESMGFHQSLILNNDLDKPVNKDYLGLGSNPPEKLSNALEVLQSLEDDIQIDKIKEIQ